MTLGALVQFALAAAIFIAAAAAAKAWALAPGGGRIVLTMLLYTAGNLIMLRLIREVGMATAFSLSAVLQLVAVNLVAILIFGNGSARSRGSASCSPSWPWRSLRWGRASIRRAVSSGANSPEANALWRADLLLPRRPKPSHMDAMCDTGKATMLKRWIFAMVSSMLVLDVLAVAPAARAATPADTLVIAKNIDDMISLDPAEDYELSGLEVDTNIYDRLMRFDADDVTKLVGGAAESWTTSADGKTFTFKLRPGMTFASGHPLRAEDAAFSLRRVIKLDKNPAFLISQLGWTKDNVDAMVKPLDETTLQLTIDADFAPSLVLSLLSSIVGSVVDEKLALDHQQNGDFGNSWLKANSAGSGAFTLRSWKANESVVLDANPAYRGGAPVMKRVVIRHVPEPAAQRLQIEKGDIDIARDLSPDQVAGLAGNMNVTVTPVPQATLAYIGLNLKTPQFDNVKVRQALHYLVDYKGMTDTFLKGEYSVHQSFWPSGFWAALNENEYGFDPAKAKTLLTEAGYPDGFEVTLDAPNSAPYFNMAQAIQATMAQGGIKVSILPEEQKTLLTRYRARQHQMLLVYWGPDYMDPHTNADSFARNTDNSDNPKSKPLAWRNAWDIPDISRMTDAAVRERDAGKREQMYMDLQKTVMDVGPFIIMFQETKLLAQRANVKNFVMGPSADVIFYRLAAK